MRSDKVLLKTRSHANQLRNGFFTPRTVNGTPNSLLNLFSLLRTKKREDSTVATASFVEVFPTEPVIITMRGRYLRTIALATSASVLTIIIFKSFFIGALWLAVRCSNS